MSIVENIREKLWDCCKYMTDEQILMLDSVYTKLARRLIFQYVAMLKAQMSAK